MTTKPLKKMLIASLLITSLASAQTPSNSQLDRCDAALNAKILEASLCAQGLDLRNQEIERLSKENDKLRERGTGLLDNPAVWAAIGVIAGAFVTARVVR